MNSWENPFTITTKKVKYLGVNLKEKYKFYMKKTLQYILWKDTKVYLNKCRDMLSWWIEYLDLIKN